MDHYDESNHIRQMNEQAPKETPVGKKFVSTGYLTGYVTDRTETSMTYDVMTEIMKHFKQGKS